MTGVFCCWVNQTLSDSVIANERALHFGDGVFETIRLQNGSAPLLDFHLARLQQGLHHLAIPLSDDAINADIALAIDASTMHPHQVFRLKYLISRGSIDAPYRIHVEQRLEATRIMSLSAFNRDVSALQSEGVSIQFCHWPVSINPRLAGLKHLNRLDQVMASRELAADVFEGIMLSSDGHENIIEGTFSNLLMRDKKGNWLTPDLRLAGVEGVMRDYVINTVLPEMGFDCSITSMTSLVNISECYLMNAMMGVIPVRHLQAPIKQSFTVSDQGRQLINRSQQLFNQSSG